MHATKNKMLQAGLAMLLERGYHNVGVQDLLNATGTTKSSFYHHFKSKEDFTLQVIDAYMDEVHEGLHTFLGDDDVAPVQRVRNFFEGTRDKYESEGYLGCMLGALGQELSGVNETFRGRIDECLMVIGNGIAGALKEAQRRGDLDDNADPDALAMLVVNAWEGAALRSRLRRGAQPLNDMLDFVLNAVAKDAA